MNTKLSIFSVLILLSGVFFASCKKDKNDDLDSNAEYFFSAKLDGQNLLFEVTPTNDLTAYFVNLGAAGDIECTFSYGGGIGPVFSTDDPSVVVSFPDIFVGDCTDEADAFSGLFKTGSYSYGSTTGKVIVSYWDGTEHWTSELVAQSNASFKVTSSEREETIFGVTQKVSGTANCVLTNGSGQNKTLENAKFTLAFSPD